MHDLLIAIENSGFPTWIRESPSLWAYTFVLSLHAIGLAVVAGLSSALDLRLLGVARAVPLAPLQALFPFMYAGFWINAASGLALLAANATGMLANPLFYLKIGLVLAAVLLMRGIKSVFGDPSFVSAGVVPARARLLAGASLACWGGAIVAGRMTAYPGLIQSWFTSTPVGVT